MGRFSYFAERASVSRVPQAPQAQPASDTALIVLDRLLG